MSIAWVRATASLWGYAGGDGPEQLTDSAPVRVRCDVKSGIDGFDMILVLDRALSLKTFKNGTHTCLRFEFKPGKVFEIGVHGLENVYRGHTADIQPS